MDRLQHLKEQAEQEGFTSWIHFAFSQILERMTNGIFIIGWTFLFAWVPLFVGKLWRRLCLKLVLRRCGKNLNVSTGVHIEYPWRITVGDNVWIGRQCHLEGMGEIVIGNYTMLAYQTVLQTAGHGFRGSGPMRLQQQIIAPIIIEDNVWLGARSMVRYGITIREGAIVGMGGIVTKDVELRIIVGGVPAKPIGSRE